MPGFSNHRNSRPPLLPTPSMPQYSRNLSMMSDASKSMDESETAAEIDMDLSDDDVTGMDKCMGKLIV